MTMLRARLAICLVAVLALGAATGTARSDSGAPTNLHAFVLRADDAPKTSFSSTPSFAWSPVPGALKYQFQLSLASSFRDNAIIYADQGVPSPVVAPQITLPWITGSPHALYARVRAVTSDGAGDWSAAFGFDMVPPAPPTPLPSYPGLIRWTPVPGVSYYEVWLVDARTMEITTTNVLDEREFFTFHPTTNWTGTIRWRIRVLRPDVAPVGTTRLNSIPAARWGAWSPTYSSTNTATAGGALQLRGTVSDVYSDGSSKSPAHRLMPAFLFSGNTGLDGKAYDLFRVEVFSDRQCINRVFTGAVTGAPAYAPRPFGTLALPTTSVGVAAARGMYLGDGGEGTSITPDGDILTPTESLPPITPTGAAPGDPTSQGGDTSTSSGGTSSGGSGGGGTLTWSGQWGAPVDLWDTDWPASGYYWTVIPVSAAPPDALSTGVKAPGAKAGDTTIAVNNSQGFNVGDAIDVGNPPSVDTATITAVGDGTLTIATKLSYTHVPGEPVVRSSGTLQYRDTELAQDVCASGRISRFGKESEPSLTDSGELFASGLSSTGKLVAASDTTAFYGQPLISWTPALGATAYEVQWSKTAKPFVAEPIPGSGNKGYLTAGTSLVLPVTAGTWYYRVRGYDYSLPTKAQQMSWSDVAKIVVARPTFTVVPDRSTKKFKIVGGSTATKGGGATKTGGTTQTSTASLTRTVQGFGFNFRVPSTWNTTRTAGGVSAVGPGNGITATTLKLMNANYAAAAASWARFASKSGTTVTPKPTTLPAGNAKMVAANVRSKSGTRVTELNYFVEGDNATYVLVFDSPPNRYVANLALFARIAASIRKG
jgi:hypothetical protein